MTLNDWTPREPAPTERMSDSIYGSLRHLIISGKMPPWTRLVEEDLAEEFNTSRSPVREALRRLGYDGLVKILRRGHLVSVGITREEREDLHRIRLELDRLAARIAVDRHAEISWEPARQAVVEMAEVLATHGVDSKEFSMAHQNVHESIHRASFRGDLPIIYVRQVLSVASFVDAQTPGSPHIDPVEQHSQLIDDLSSGDLTRALEAATFHATQGRERANQRLADELR